MTRETIKEDQIFLAFYEDGTCLTARGIFNTDDYKGIKKAFIVPDKTPLYQLSNFWGFNKIPDTWKGVII